MVITEGRFENEEVLRSGFTEAELKARLAKKGVSKIGDILVASSDRNGRIFIQFKED